MSEVIIPPGSTEPVFGLKIFSEETYVARQVPDDEPTDDCTPIEVSPLNPNALSDDIITAVDSASTAYSYTVISGAGEDLVELAACDDVVVAGAGDDIVFAKAGDDTVLGGSGDDALYGQAGDDIVFGGSGDDLVFGGSGDDIVRGGSGDDVVKGGSGEDVLSGGGGDDLLIGGAGSDILTGGLGEDVFRLGKDAAGAVDKITDFNPDEDILELSKSLLPASGLDKGKLSSSDFAVVDTFGSGVSASIVYESSTGKIYYNPSTPGSAPVALVQVDKNLDLSADALKIIG